MKPREMATATELRAIFGRALSLWSSLFENGEPFYLEGDRIYEHNTGVDLVLETLRFCSAAAAELRDPALADMVASALRITNDYDDRASSHQEVMRYALSRLLEAGAPVGDGIRDLAASTDAPSREAIATGLRPRGQVERALLEKLAADPVADVRRAAKKSLAMKLALPWWTGKWKSDPAARLLPGEEERGGAALRRLSELLDLSRDSLLAQHREEFFEVLEELPNVLAVEALEQLCHVRARYPNAGTTALFLALFEREGGLDALERLVASWGFQERDSQSGYRGILRTAVEAAPPELRAAICTRLLALITAAPVEHRWTWQNTAAKLAAEVIESAWPPEASIAPVLDVLLAAGAEKAPEQEEGEWMDQPFDRVASSLSGALCLPGIDPAPVLDRLLEARLAGYPPPWKAFSHRADELLSRAPASVRRGAAERALAAEDHDTIRWGARQILGETSDSEIDGDPQARALALFAQPRLRAALASDRDFARRALPVLRPLLRSGALSYPEAVHTIEAIGDYYGGVAQPGQNHAFVYRRDGRDEELEELLRKARDKRMAFLPPPELAGPPIEAEWQALRHARAAHPKGKAEMEIHLWARSLRDGPWTPEELADLNAFSEAQATTSPQLDFWLSQALASKPDLTLLPMFDKLLATSDADTRPLLERYHEATRKALGLPAKPSTDQAPTEDAESASDEAGEDEDPEEDDWTGPESE